MFLEQGAKRVVFEGRECGGHVGPMSSMVLWDSMVRCLLDEVTTPEQAEGLCILFAGGIHDAASAAMVACFAAPLAARGISCGVLMGTAYLFTKEAVESGTIVEGFQKIMLDCERTVTLETGPGHASRAAMSDFADEFAGERRKLESEGVSSQSDGRVQSGGSLRRSRASGAQDGYSVSSSLLVDRLTRWMRVQARHVTGSYSCACSSLAAGSSASQPCTCWPVVGH